jgi:hypothetical protein
MALVEVLLRREARKSPPELKPHYRLFKRRRARFTERKRFESEIDRADSATEAFSSKSLPPDLGWIPVRGKKTRQNKI